MKDLCFYFQVHQPYRLNAAYNFFSIGKKHSYFDDGLNKMILQRVAEKCYLPANKLMRELIAQHNFSVTFSLSGVFIEQCEKWAPEVLASFRDLYATGKVEFLAETYHHSLTHHFSSSEFAQEVASHAEILQRHFGAHPQVFRNTELLYDNALAKDIQAQGYTGIIAEGAEQVLSWRSPGLVYQPEPCDSLALLLRNYKLSDDIAFRFNENDMVLDHRDFIASLHAEFETGEVIHLCMDYETFGEHQSKETGIFDFFRRLCTGLPKESIITKTCSEVVTSHSPVAKLNVEETTSWADRERDISPWLGNVLQRSAAHFLFELEGAVSECNDMHIAGDWRKLLSSDHLYYMSTKGEGDGEVHRYFSPFSTPHDAYVVYTNVLNDLAMRLEKRGMYVPDLRFGWSE